MPAPEFSIVIPCFNEEKAIALTVAALSGDGSDSRQVVVVDDGSTDKTADILEGLTKQYPGLVVLRHHVNKGYGAALKTGIRHAGADLIVITDADGTYPNERIGELVKLCRDQDMVVGARIGADVQYPFIRKVPKVFLKAYAAWLSRYPIPDLNSGLRVFRKNIVERFFNILPDGFSFTTTITVAMLTNHYRVKYVPISYVTRIGKSKIKPIRDTLRFFQLILRTGMYFAPLRVFAPFIVLLMAASAASLGYDIWQKDNIADKTVILIMFALNTFFFALLADMIDKRSSR